MTPLTHAILVLFAIAFALIGVGAWEAGAFVLLGAVGTALLAPAPESER